IRTLDKHMQRDVHERIIRTATKIAESAGATAEVSFDGKTPVTYNDPALTEKMVGSLEKAAGKENVVRIHAVTGAEDFALYQEQVPGSLLSAGACPPDIDPATAPAHHAPDFMIEEPGFISGLKAMLNVTVDYMYSNK